MDRLCVNEKSTGKILKYKLLNVLEFTSTRKRMSVIVEDANGIKTLMCKGADSIIKERLSQDSLKSEVYKETQKAVDECARIGLRTLFLAEKILDDQTYEEWNKKAEAARNVIGGRDEAIASVDELIEKEMELIGSTAIEDRL
jgi:phospholipid-translocating ATPase